MSKVNLRIRHSIVYYSFVLLVLATLTNTSVSGLNGQPQFTIKADNNKAFDESCLIETFAIKDGNIADCLEHCLENCRCQSFQICQNTECQLCSSHKEENSSLLHEEEGCVYATYGIRNLETFQNVEEQCSSTNCYMKYNCCQISGICPDNQICEQTISSGHPWKRFTCKCPEGYHGDNCEKSIMSCAGYLEGYRQPGLYKVVDSKNQVYEVYCYFDSYGSWTLVQSYSFANKAVENLKRPLNKDLPLNENALKWSGYRLSKERMISIKKNSFLLRFTCNYEKHYNVSKSDFVDLQLKGTLSSGEIDIFSQTLWVETSSLRVQIGENDLNECKIKLHSAREWPLHVHITLDHSKCNFMPNYCAGDYKYYFGSYHLNHDHYYDTCLKGKHSCVDNADSTTQLWFGEGQP